MSTVLNVKIDENLKKEAQEAAQAVGLPLSTVVAAGLREFVRTRTVIISDAPRLKPEVEAEVIRRSEEAKAGINISPAFNSLEEARQWLEK